MTPDSPTDRVRRAVQSQQPGRFRTWDRTVEEQLRRFHPCDAFVQSMQQLRTAIEKIAQCIPGFSKPAM